MSSWDTVEIGLAGGEETAVFGPRNETGSSLYQVDTLASVSPSGKVPYVLKLGNQRMPTYYHLLFSDKILP